MSKKVRVIAFYLPQFHPIPENDIHWGKGFTEWTNVGKAKPLFKGHYQPRVPADLGYYDLRMQEVREAQADMAREAGIEGFMYWHYWFGNGKRVLERPFNEVLNLGKPDFPFCLGWANHSWTTHSWNSDKQWAKNSIIFEQTYPGVDDYEKHFFEVLPAFKDSRYITVDDKPLFMIYAPKDVPDVQSFISLWRKLASENGLKGIHFVALSSGWMDDNHTLLSLGFDAINTRRQWEAESQVDGKYWRIFKEKFNKKIAPIFLKKYKYESIIRYLDHEDDAKNNYYPTILPQWDRSARSGRNGVIYHNSTPSLFGAHIDRVLKRVESKSELSNIVFLKSWNEWAEGNYMEPDIKWGDSYLKELSKRIK